MSSANNLGTGINLSDPQYAAGRRKMLDLVNRMVSTGVQYDLDMPMIAVIGSQSAGKSSLIESISNITLPRASGTCTRVPIECRLTSSSSPWECKVTLQFRADRDNKPLGESRNVDFGDTITHKSEVEERIRRAQRAVLNPSTNYRNFLVGPDEDLVEKELTFSINSVSLQISGKNVADLSFVDLPGLIANVAKGGNEGDIELVRNLVTTYIERPSCIILLTVSCETDLENQGAQGLAKKYDPEGKRTIGVLTKPDRIPPGEEDRWLRLIKNEVEQLDNGWFCVKQPDSASLKAGISWSEARDAERDYFSLKHPWSDLEPTHQRRLGTSNLADCLSDILSDLIAKRLPGITEELEKLLQTTEDELHKLPPSSSDPFSDILNLISSFSRDLAIHLEGTPNKDRLLQKIRPAQEEFRIRIRSTAPDFRPYARQLEELYVEIKERCAEIEERSVVLEAVIATPNFLSTEEALVAITSDDKAIFVDEVMRRAEDAITRELPDNYPFVVKKEYICACTDLWQDPMKELFDIVVKTLVAYVKKLVIKHFGNFSHSGLQGHVMNIVTDYIKLRSEQASERLIWLLQLEMQPATLNTHYFKDYRDKFLSYYRACRWDRGGKNSLTSQLQNYSPPSGYHPNQFNDCTSKALSGVAGIGISGIEPTDLAKLLPADKYEPALHIMAEVRAYFQVAYKRFVDNVPMAIDYELILGLDRDCALEKAIRAGLGITGPDGHKRCEELLREPAKIRALRDDLEKKRDRLKAAKKELMTLCL
ncbi:P-loop containing nucleoside triphosphate hydrolase protein [Abortiporus biennis]|nr:P-loop containing nucleoside triphosphate hydrolase protein [Abortiporus biennis]